jgi:phage tail-like protein
MSQEFLFQLQIVGPESTQSYAVPIGSVTMGRQVGNDILLEHALVSRRHAQVDCTPESCQITDLGSSNGTRVNGEPLTPNSPVFLSDGDVIQVGPFELTVEQTAVERAVEEEPVPEEAPPPPEEPQPEDAVSAESADDEGEEEAKAKELPQEEEAQPPPDIPPPASPPEMPPEHPLPSHLPPGLSNRSTRYLEYLPGIYHTDLMARFLGIFESILTPIEWNVDNFDLYLDAGTAPASFLAWLANWFELTFDDTWTVEQRRTLLKDAHKIYARRGTSWALSRMLEIYTEHTPEIDDKDGRLADFTFSVSIPVQEKTLNRTLIERIIDMNKPAQASYRLRFKR